MQTLIKGSVIVGLTMVVVGCAQPVEETPPPPPPVIIEEPTGKF